MQTLNYKVENAQIVTLQRTVDFEGQTATISYDRAVIECVPADGDGQVIGMVLPSEALADFPEGLAVTITIEAAAPVAEAEKEA